MGSISGQFPQFEEHLGACLEQQPIPAVCGEDMLPFSDALEDEKEEEGKIPVSLWCSARAHLTAIRVLLMLQGKSANSQPNSYAFIPAFIGNNIVYALLRAKTSDVLFNHLS